MRSLILNYIFTLWFIEDLLRRGAYTPDFTVSQNRNCSSLVHDLSSPNNTTMDNEIKFWATVHSMLSFRIKSRKKMITCIACRSVVIMVKMLVCIKNSSASSRNIYNGSLCSTKILLIFKTDGPFLFQKSEKAAATSDTLRNFYNMYPHLKAAEVYAIVSYHNVKARLPKFLKHFDRLLEGDSRLHLVISALETDQSDIITEVNKISKESQDRVSQVRLNPWWMPVFEETDRRCHCYFLMSEKFCFREM